ncbi:hypothetical protein N2152v2_000054 [Parachlorella kessleri]
MHLVRAPPPRDIAWLPGGYWGFEAMLYFQLSWRDPRAQTAIENATAAAASDPGYNNGNGCQFPCTSLFDWTPGTSCCDGVFLPDLEFVNARGFSQDRPDRWRVAVNEEPGNDAVIWWSYVLGEFYSPMQFHAFPFDEQKLLVQMQYGHRNASSPVRFIASATGTELYRPRTGDDLSGWNIKAVEILPYNFSHVAGSIIRASAGATYSAPGDPWPINPANKSVTPFTSQLWTEGVDVVITVGRISNYYIIVALLPIAVNVWLCLLVFFISPRHLDTRLGVVVTMFLSLTAIQFVISSVLPSSSTVVPTQQLVIVSYAVLAIIGIMSIVVYFVITADRQRSQRERGRHASRAFTHRWTTLVRGDSLASAAGMEAAAAVAAAAPGPAVAAPQPMTSPMSAPDQQCLLPGGTAAAAIHKEPLGDMGVEIPMPVGQEASKLKDDEDAEDKSYRGSDSEADSPPVFREGKGRWRQGTWGESGPPQGDPAPGASWGCGDGDSPCASKAAGSCEGGDLEAGHGQQQHRGQQAQRAQHGGGDGIVGLEVERGGNRRGWWAAGGWRPACCAWQWWREALLWPWRWLVVQQLRFKEMLQEAQQNKEYAEHLARSLDRVVFWVVLAGYNVAVVIIFALGAQWQADYAFEHPDG